MELCLYFLWTLIFSFSLISCPVFHVLAFMKPKMILFSFKIFITFTASVNSSLFHTVQHFLHCERWLLWLKEEGKSRPYQKTVLSVDCANAGVTQPWDLWSFKHIVSNPLQPSPPHPHSTSVMLLAAIYSTFIVCQENPRPGLIFYIHFPWSWQ